PEEHDIGMAFAIEKVLIEMVKVPYAASVCQGLAVVPVPTVTRIEVHFSDGMANGGQRASQTVEKRRADALQEQEAARHGLRANRAITRRRKFTSGVPRHSSNSWTARSAVQ